MNKTFLFTFKMSLFSAKCGFVHSYIGWNGFLGFEIRQNPEMWLQTVIWKTVLKRDFDPSAAVPLLSACRMTVQLEIGGAGRVNKAKHGTQVSDFSIAGHEHITLIYKLRLAGNISTKL